MRKATATYIAPEGDADSCIMAGVRFVDGEPVELNSDEHGALISKLEGNQHFDIEVGEDDGKTREKPKRGRPSNKDKAEKKAADDRIGLGNQYGDNRPA